ncbi:MAG TPA: PQQ-binding-like beta-propeller repeat protein [Ktedonobacterales bacterium]|nr:PQQ-binding-like beta-propeller repeat protein [Ktedonobacterales bacterium]
MRARIRWFGLGMTLLCVILTGCGASSTGTRATATATVATATVVQPTATSTPSPKTSNVYYATSDHVLTALNTATGAIRWTFTKGVDIGAPILVGNLVYVTALNPQGTTIYALDSTSGSVIWSAEGGTPILAGDALYMSTGSTINCLDAATGKQRWQQPFAGTLLTVTSDTVFAGAGTSTSGQGGASVLDSSTLTAFNTTDGAIPWSFTRAYEGFDSPEVADGVVYFMARSGDNTGPVTGHLYALNTADSSQRWKVNVGQQALANTFALSDGMFLAGGSATGITGYRASDGAQIWTNTDPMFSYFTVAGNAAYVKSFNSVAVALEVTTGKELWDTSVLVTSPATPPVAANGALYVSGGRGPGQIAAINSGTGAIQWTKQEPGAMGLPSVTIDTVYAYTMGPSPVVYAFNAADGTLRWQHQTGKNLVAGLTVIGEVGSD